MKLAGLDDTLGPLRLDLWVCHPNWLRVEMGYLGESPRDNTRKDEPRERAEVRVARFPHLVDLSISGFSDLTSSL